jgi:hypothetical protein
MLQDPAFDSKEIDPDLHKRMDKAAMCMRWQVRQLKRLVPSNAQDNMDVGSPCPELGPEDGDCFMPGQMLQEQKRPSTLIQQFWYYHWYIYIQYMVPMYSVCTRINTVCTCICNVCAWFNQLSKQPFLGGI